MRASHAIASLCAAALAVSAGAAGICDAPVQLSTATSILGVMQDMNTKVPAHGHTHVSAVVPLW